VEYQVRAVPGLETAEALRWTGLPRGIELSESRNAQTAGVISMDASRATVRVIRTDEDLMIARSVSRILETGAKPHTS